MKLIAAPGRPLNGDAAIPGDKSCSHRALILGGLAEGQTTVDGLLECDDVMATAHAIEALGSTVERVEPGVWQVRGCAWQSPDAPLDCGNSGTTARLLMGAIAGQEPLSAELIGDPSLSARPMARVTEPLRRMGAKFEGGPKLPIRINGGRLGGIDHRNVPASAQVKSALLLAGLSTKAAVQVVEPVPSRDHTEIMLGQFGCDVLVDDTPEGWVVSLGERRSPIGTTISIGADPSSSAFPLVAAAIVPGSVVSVRGVLVNPLRTGLFETLEAMGTEVEVSNEKIRSGEIVADITIRSSRLRPCHVRPDQVPAMIDEIPALAIACAFADGESLIEGLSELRVKESDRLGSLVAGLTACGVTALADGDSLRIFGRQTAPGGASIVTQGDHRIAMAFLTMGLAADCPVEIDGAEMIASSFPGFVEVMQRLGADIR